jgi:hypothetical protein
MVIPWSEVEALRLELGVPALRNEHLAYDATEIRSNRTKTQDILNVSYCWAKTADIRYTFFLPEFVSNSFCRVAMDLVGNINLRTTLVINKTAVTTKTCFVHVITKTGGRLCKDGAYCGRETGSVLVGVGSCDGTVCFHSSRYVQVRPGERNALTG